MSHSLMHINCLSINCQYQYLNVYLTVCNLCEKSNVRLSVLHLRNTTRLGAQGQQY